VVAGPPHARIPFVFLIDRDRTVNKNLHRIIFNHKRGQLMAVGETVSANGKAAGGQTTSPAAPAGASGGGAAWHPLRHSLALAMGALLSVQPAFHVAQAQVIADPSAPGNQRPTVLPAANGVTQVNIQTPSAAGVSRNTYIQFDVQQQGVILNNSRTNVQTQLGGFVQANPWLAGGGARVILNEVNSSNPSQLRGFVEVAGQRAEVIIANPAGINVNGGGFINASGVTLTTGATVVNSGNLEAFRVQGGVVNISGSGLDTASADYTSILARAVQVNAGIWAKALRVVTGANQVSADLAGVTPIAGTGPAPSFALDVAQLGGMYAGKIFIIGTETGLGTSNAGVIGATAGDIVLQANGWLTNTGSIQTAGQLQATAAGDINNSRLMAAGGNTTLQATGAGAKIVSSTNAVIAAGLKADGTLGSGDLTLTATGNAALNGQTLSAGNAAISAAQLDLTDGKLSGQTVAVTSTAGGIDASRAQVKAQGLLTLTTSQTLRTDGAAISAGQLQLGAVDLSNVGGEIVQLGTGNTVITATGALDNTRGRIASNGNTTISAASLNNLLGNVQAAGTATLDLTVAGILSNQADSPLNGQISAGGDATIRAGTVTNQGVLQSGAALTLSATDISNAVDSKLTGTNTRITATNSLTNRGLIDGVDTRIDAPTVNNIGTGKIYGDTLSIAATTLNNSAETIAGVTKAAVIAGRDRLDIGAGTLNNGIDALIFSGGTGAAALNIGGSLDAARHATGSALAVNNAGGTIESMGGLTITAAQINNTNPDFAYTVQLAAGPQVKEYITAQGIYTSNDVAWELGSMTPASHGGYLYAGGQGRFLPKGAAYSDAVYAAYYSGPSPYVAEHSIDTSSGDNTSSIYVPPVFGYLAGHPAWALFGVASPVTAPPGAKPTGTTVGDGDSSGHIPPTPAELAAWEAAIAPWVALQARVEAMRATVNAAAIAFDGLRDYNQSVPSATVTRSTPGRFLSAGAMTLSASSALLNDQSQIIAGGALNITGQALENRGRTPVVNAQRTGRAYAWSNYNEGCGSVKGCDYNYDAYRDSDYTQTVPQTLNLNVYRSDSLLAPASQGVGSGFQKTTTTTAGTAATIPAAPLITLPASSLFRTNPNPAASYLIETDPLFTNLRQWLGSDYMLATLSLDPTVTQKRLGDGFYEQRLMREQVAQLTGLRFLGNFTSDEQQYRALMDAGITFAQQFQLRPGIALSAAQIAQLTSDIVWLVERDVSLPDGSTTKALVPTVYVHTRTGDLNGQGVLLAGREVNINLSGDLTNSGTIAGRTVVSLTAENVHNINGRITGDAVAVAARNDINVTGGTIDAASSLTAIAGRDINVATTTSSASNRTGGLGSGGNATAVNASSNNTFSMTGIDRVAGLYVTGNAAGAPGTLIASAGRDINLIAAVIGNNSTTGSTTLTAGNNINLATVTTANSSDQRRGDDDFVRDAQTKEVGSQIQTAGSLRLSAGNDLNARAANVQATGDLTASAGNSVNLTAGRETNSFGFGLTTAESDLFSSSSTRERRTADQDNAVGSSLGGKTVTIVSGKDINVKGSAVISDTGTTLAAGRNIAIEAAQNTSSSTSFFEKKESGFFQEGLSYNASEQSNDRQGRSTTAAASTVGALQGNVVAVANNDYRQVGSDVISPQGNITISAATVNVVEARETSRSTTEDKTSQSGFGVTFSNPVLSAIEGVQQSAQTISNASKVKDSRIQALAAASTALTAYNTYNQVAALVSDPTAAASIGINLSIGSSKSQSNTENTSNTAAGSNVAAGGDVTIAATGAGLDSNLTVQGSRINAGGNASLLADNQVNLLAAINTASERNSNSNSGASLGIGFSVGAKSGFSLNASASSGKGEGNGDEISYSNTQVQAGNTLVLASGGDTNLIGAVAAAKQVTVQTGGNLTIQSLQDKSTYTESQSSAGGGVSLCIPPFCFGASSGSFSAGKSNIDSNFQSVGQQSAIRAGDGGFSVNAGGNTTLAGGQITSTQKAVNEGKNSFAIGGALTLIDIQNVAGYEGGGYRLGGGISGTLGDQTSNEARQEMANRGMSDQDSTRVKNTANNIGGGVGFGSESGNAASTTTAGISGIAGNTAARTGDAEAGLKPIFNKDQVKASIDAQIAITQSFGRDASKAVGDYAEARLQEARALARQADTEPDEAKAKALTAQAKELTDNWGANGTLRLAAHTIIGGLTGGASGALGAAAGTLTAPLVAQALADAGISGPLAQTLTVIASTAVGVAAGGTAGGAAAANEVVNNYLSHPDASRLRSLQKKLNAGQLTPEETRERAELIAKDEQTNLQLRACTYSTTSACQNVRSDYAAALQSYMPTQEDIQTWAIKKAQSGPYTADQLVDAYNLNFTKGPLPAEKTQSGNLTPAADWIREQLSEDAKKSEANLLDKVYMGWATANSPYVAAGIVAGFIAKDALISAGQKVAAIGTYLVGSNKITVYRVEGSPNARISIGDDGSVAIQGEQTLFLNFGSKQRAIEFFNKRIDQGMQDVEIKSFQINKKFLDDLKATAVPESLARQNPGSPILVDPTKAANQFGLRPAQVEALRNAIISGSGKNGL
jgi:filamentous hemagglutinin